MSLASILSAVQQGVTAMNNLGSQVKITFAQAPLIPSFWNFPTTAGSSSQLLTSAGGGPQYWTTPSQLPGTTTNDNASAGNIGEYATANVLSSQAVVLATGTVAAIASLPLAVGDYDVWINSRFSSSNGATNPNRLVTSISSSSNTLDISNGRFFQFGTAAPFVNALGECHVTAGATRITLASSGTFYFLAQADFGAGAVSVFGIMQSRRRR